MTNYDRWKLATPDYLEDTDGDDGKGLRIHDTDVDVEGGHDLRRSVQLSNSDAQKGAC